jgi:hypothetical protein
MVVLSLASSKAGAKQALKLMSTSRGRIPTLGLIRSTPTTSFRSAYNKAREAAKKHGKTTVMDVVLTDVHIFELAKQGKSEQYFSFAHSFVVAIGPQGFVVWQGWGEHGYRLDEWIGRDRDCVRDWDKVEEFVNGFVKLTADKVDIPFRSSEVVQNHLNRRRLSKDDC